MIRQITNKYWLRLGKDFEPEKFALLQRIRKNLNICIISSTEKINVALLTF